ncbi:hypothetical protein, partial [Chitinophaga sp.]|uniref:hypothetical protein n=1 Tax=Chitinophaga sp. TaxID=1869181 RepID=UPI0031DEC151
GNLREAIGHLNATMGNFTRTSASLNNMLDPKHGNVPATFDNLQSLTANLEANNDKITAILANAEKTTAALSSGQLDKTLLELQQMAPRVNETIAKLNSTDGTTGILLKDKKAKH